MSINPLTPERAREDAAYVAAKELRRLHVDQSQPIDIFGIIEEAGIWLFFAPLSDVQGVFLRDAETGQKAILINSRRPLSMQRLTAAHEYGHYVLGHEASLDDAADVEPSETVIIQEAAAQVFANDFLMPPQLVQRLWRDLALPDQAKLVGPHQVYLLSLSLGVSYKALIFQLVSLRKISRSLASRLAKYQPRKIKQEILGRGIGPVDSYADVWPIDENDDGRVLNVRVNDELSIALPEIPSAGYRWTVRAPEIIDLSAETSTATSKAAMGALLEANKSTGVRLAILGDEFEGDLQEQGDVRAGVGGRRYFTFRVMQPGTYELRLELRRPWQRSGIPARAFHVDINSIPKATGDQDKGVRDSLKQPLANSAALHDVD